jgi:ABC-type antimicrobial peptide transport system permease subunit
MTAFFQNKIVLVFISLLISTAVFILVFFITYTLACIISPPYFEGDNGEKYPVMPMGQTFLGIILGIIFGIVSLWLSYRKLKRYKMKKMQNEREA